MFGFFKNVSKRENRCPSSDSSKLCFARYSKFFTILKNPTLLKTRAQMFFLLSNMIDVLVNVSKMQAVAQLANDFVKMNVDVHVSTKKNLHSVLVPREYGTALIVPVNAEKFLIAQQGVSSIL
ncbi:hypothetical protein AVEN_272712-1 [Araneus ventricosus]|uniref:Uncharacterized protein n=1 Tax=Araneus ventricosus TaxID=182803 RepID=A0A4Y2SX82_ARAVE|nr:hypothetical protein AVEN_272712-1 [Araneus ventricosus]